MKKENRRAISFITTMALIFTTFFSPGVSFAAETGTPEALTGSATVSSFSDINGHWGEVAINQAVSNGFVKGYTDGTFKPDQPVTRAEFVTMVNKALQLRDENTVNLLFKDVKASDWFYKDIQKASYARYVSGVSDTSFMPGENISRQEAAAMLSRFLPKSGFMGETQVSAFPDASNVSTWAKSALAVVINKGYMSGHANGNLAPLGTLTRAEAAKIIGKILDNETIIREDVSVVKAGDLLKDKIHIGDITIEKSVGEGEAILENLTALSKVYILGGGVSTVTIKDALIIQLIVAKEGTKVRVLSNGDTTIFETFLFNGNLVVDEFGSSENLGAAGYEHIIYIEGTISAADAIKLAKEITGRMDNTGNITKEQAAEGAAAVLTGTATTLNPDGSIKITVEAPAEIPVARHHHSTSAVIPDNGGDSGNENGDNQGENLYDYTLTPITSPHVLYCGHTASEGGFTQLATITIGGVTTTAYAISTPEQLQHLAMHLNFNALLVSDIGFSSATGAGVGTPMGALSAAAVAAPGLSLSALRVSSFTAGNFVPIGSTSYRYTGTFYGNDKTISGLNITASAVDQVGLFGYISGAAIQDLTISGGSVNGRYHVGGLVGYAMGSTISGITSYLIISGRQYVGGIVGNSNLGTVTDCYNTGAVAGSGTHAGGVVGYNQYGTVTNCYNTGAVGKYGYVGGVAGYNYNGTVTDCFNIGAVTGSSLHVGGVVGYNNGTVTDCYNTGAVTGTEYVGGVSGYNVVGTVKDCYNTGAVGGSSNVGGDTAGNVGGVIGWNTGTVENSYNTGAVGGSSNVGGVVGQNRGTVTNSYNTGVAAGSGDYIGGVVGYNTTTVAACSWLFGTNLKNLLGIGRGTGDATTFASISLGAIYTSMSAIATSAGGTTVGAITDIVFSTGYHIPNAFSLAQGSYIVGSGTLIMTVSAISNTTITVTTESSLTGLISPGGMVVPGIITGMENAFSIGTSDTWVMIKADCTNAPWLKRNYIFYFI